MALIVDGLESVREDLSWVFRQQVYSDVHRFDTQLHQLAHLQIQA